MKEAAFSLKGYNFPMVKMNLSGIKPGQNNFSLNISPEGIFSLKDRTFTLSFKFDALLNGEMSSPCVEITCVGIFEFKNIESLADIPAYFYANSIAILFPYVRAFVSTVTLQANFQPIVLPTMNLADLSNVLKERVKVTE